MDSRPGAVHQRETVPPELRPIIKDGLTTQMMSTLTGGVFLVAFALMLGASAPVIGLLAAIPPLAQLIQIPSIYLIERYRARRKITVIAAAISRVFLLLIAAIPFLFSPAIGLAVLITGLALHASFGAVGGCSWNSWMHDLLPHDRLGSFFSKRMGLATAVGIPLSLAAGSFIDHWQAHLPLVSIYGYSILFTLGFLAGLLGVYFISKIPEPSMAVLEEGRWDFLFFFAFLLGLYSLHRLSLVREIGEVEEKVILQELFSVVGRELKDISTAFGLRDITLFPFSILRSTLNRRKSRD